MNEEIGLSENGDQDAQFELQMNYQPEIYKTLPMTAPA
jgi:hypothetical protein